MKLKSTFILILPLLLLSSIATGQAERTFVKSFNLLNKQTVVLNLGDNIQVIPWDSDIMRVQMTVSLPFSTDATLKALAETGRYMLKSDVKEQSFVLTAPFLQNSIKINGNLLKESIIYVIYTPKGVTVTRNEDIASQTVTKTKS
jgi:hypothetical protein